MIAKLTVLFSSCLALAACAGEPADYEGGDPLGPSLRERMVGPQRLTLAASAPEGGSFVSALVGGSLAGEPQQVTLPVVGGVVATRTEADGRVLLEQLEVELADVVLSEQEFPPHGLWLSGLRLSADRSVAGDVAWSEDEQAGALAVELDLLLDWGVVLSDGELHPLATQTVRGVRFEVDIGRSGPVGVSMALGAFAEGVVWRWSSLVEVSDLGMELVAGD